MCESAASGSTHTPSRASAWRTAARRPRRLRRPPPAADGGSSRVEWDSSTRQEVDASVALRSGAPGRGVSHRCRARRRMAARAFIVPSSDFWLGVSEGRGLLGQSPAARSKFYKYYFWESRPQGTRVALTEWPWIACWSRVNP